MYLAHFCIHISELFQFMTKLGCETYREHTYTLKPSDIFVQILYICMNFVSGSNCTLEQIFGCLFLEVSAVGDVNWAIMPVQRLIDTWISEMVIFELYQSVTALRIIYRTRNIPSSSVVEDLQLSIP